MSDEMTWVNKDERDDQSSYLTKYDYFVELCKKREPDLGSKKVAILFNGYIIQRR